MKAYNVLVIALGLAAGGVAPLRAQTGTVELVPTTGYMIFGDMLRGPIGTSLSNTNGALFGAQLMLPMGDAVAFYVNGAYARSELEVGVPVLGGLAVGDTDAWMADAGIELRAGKVDATRPFLQLGAGAAHYDIRTPILSTESTNLVFAVGAGVDVPLTPGVGLRLMVRDQIGEFDFSDATGIGIQGRTAHNVALNVGLRLRIP